MPAAKPADLPPAARKLVTEIEKLFNDIELNAKSTDDDRVAADIRKELKPMQAELDALRKSPDAKAEGKLRALTKKAKALDISSDKRCTESQDKLLRREAQGRVSGKMMEWMTLLGRITDPTLSKPLIAEQALWRKALDAIERSRDDWRAFTELKEFERQLPKMLAKAQEAQGVQQWLRSAYEPAVARARAAAKRVPGEGCRRALGAEIEAIEGTRRDGFAKGDVSGAKGRSLGRLQAVERLVARIAATSPAIDREFDRIDAMLKKAGSPTALAESLRSLRMHKAGGWPKATSVDEMEREIGAFESAVARFAAQAAKEVAAGAKTAA